MPMMKTKTRSRVENPGDTRAAYPADLARFVRESWGAEMKVVGDLEPVMAEAPETRVLERLFSTCYQASLLREEGRPLRFRAILTSPADLPGSGGPPGGLQHLTFSRPRPFDERELRRLSPAADFERTLLGVRLADGGELEIWGIIHSGLRWLQVALGERRHCAPLPSVPVVGVEGPGRLTVSRGFEFVAELADGKVVGSHTDIFPSRWLRGHFTNMGEELRVLHEESRTRAAACGEMWASLDPELPRMIARQMYLRLFSTLSESRHGATIVNVPAETAGRVLDEHISLKHSFEEGEYRRSFRDLILGIMDSLARDYGGGEENSDSGIVGWKEYVHSENPILAEIDEAISEFAHLVAGLAAVDGAVVMTDRGELLGFGGEISGGLEPILEIEKALDPEGNITAPESAEADGTRHRSAYRLSAATPGALVVVISQDGNIRFVTDVDGTVTCWDQA